MLAYGCAFVPSPDVSLPPLAVGATKMPSVSSITQLDCDGQSLVWHVKPS
jgi:hypothetical protein